MPEQLIKILTPIKAKWDALTRRQQIQLVSVTAALLLVLILFLFFALRTRWITLYDRQDYARISQIHAALEAEGIRNRPHPSWTGIDVPARDRTAALGAIFANAGTAASRMELEDALDLVGLGTTEAQSAATLLKAHETDVANILVRIDGIADASVSIINADRNLLLRPNQPPASMAVVLTTTRHFPQSEGRTLAELLRNTVRGLELDNITIVDQHNNGIFLGGMMPETDSAMDVLNMRLRQEAQLMDDVRRSFSHVFDEVDIFRNIVYDQHVGMTERIITLSAPSGSEDGLPTFRQWSQQEAEGMLGIPWGPGLGANMQASPAYMMGDPGAARASARDRTESFVHDQHVIEIESGPGGIDTGASSIAVTATRLTTIYEADWRERNPEATREDWLEFVDNNVPNFVYEHDTEEAMAMRMFIAIGTGIPLSNVAVRIQEIFSIVEVEETGLPIATIIMLAVLLLLIAMLLFAVLARRKEEEEDVEPELSVEDLLATTQLEEAKDEAERLKEIEYDQDNEIKKQIDKFVNEKPEAVAALLRNWLNAEEW
ncbi:MAG: hypothetical protein FWD90_07825 [Defluviitaleaceae bacterium]|nr:hypothetical protein [Defluviitaleaceae bacterium]